MRKKSRRNRRKNIIDTIKMIYNKINIFEKIVKKLGVISGFFMLKI